MTTATAPARGLLTAEEERELARRRDAGDREARDELIRRNMPWAFRLVAGYARHHPGRVDDLEGAAMLGLIDAADRYDPGRGTRFSTVATYWIRREIMAAIQDEFSLVRVPRHVHRAISRARRGVRSREDHPATPGLVESARLALSIRAEGSAEGFEDRFATVPARPSAPDEPPAPADAAIRLRFALGFLPLRDRTVITRRFALDGERRWTLLEVARDLGISKERVRQLEGHAIARLREMVGDDES